MADRIDARQAHDDLSAGALLVCAYDDEEQLRQNQLDGAISLADFRSQERSVSRDRELVFYCA